MRWFCIGCILAQVASQASCNRETYEEKRAKEAQSHEAVEVEAKAKLTDIITQFAQKYNADQSWKDTLKSRAVSTFQLQKVLIRSDSRPVLAEVNLIDIEKHDGEFVLLFYVPGLVYSPLSQQYLVFELTCSLSDSQLDTIKMKEFYMWNDAEYLVAAQIRSVGQAHTFQKIHLDQSSSSSSLQTLNKEFVAKGQCVGLQPIGDVVREHRSKLTNSESVKPRTKGIFD